MSAPVDADVPRARASLVRRLVVGLTVAVGVASAVVVAISARRNLAAGELELARSADQTVAALARILERPLWDLDMDRVGSIGEVFSQDPRVVHLSIDESTTGRSYVVHRGDLANAVQRSAPIRHGGRPLGVVSIAFSRGGYEAQVRRQVWTGAGVVLMALVAAFVTVSLLLRRLLRRPLVDLVRTADAYAQARYATAPRVGPYVEFAPVGYALHAMGDKIQTQLRELRAHRDHLEELVHARTDELSTRNRELQQAVQSAEAANRAKSAFLSSMSHELRTPLNAILGFAHLVHHEPDATVEQRERMRIILTAGEHLLALINEVLDLAKIEAGKIEIEPTDFDPAMLVHDVAAMLRVRAQEKGLPLVVEIGASLPPAVRTDPAKLRQILTNLVGNAVKFTRTGRVTVRVQLVDGDAAAGGARLRVEVADTGVGIAAEDQERIFAPFEQVGGQRDAGGTGLGLTISRELADRLGGTITVDSAAGKGARFVVELPVGRVEGVAAGAVTSAPPVPVRRLVGLAPGQPEQRVLVVEDQADNLLLMTHILERAGYRVAIAASGEAALRQFAEWKPAFVWMDWHLPGIDGAETTRRIRAMPGGGEVHIAGLTASALPSQHAELRAAGMEVVLGKPFRPDQVLDVMADLLGVTYDHAAAPVAAEPEPAAVPLEREALASVPRELCDALRDAVSALDQDGIVAAAERIAEVAPELARPLRRSVERFEYQALLDACG